MSSVSHPPMELRVSPRSMRNSRAIRTQFREAQ